MAVLQVGSQECHCRCEPHRSRAIVLTGAPGAGKTAVLELAARCFCSHVAILPEAAAIVFGGGFPRHSSDPAYRAAQRAIFHVQREVERLAIEGLDVGVLLCERGTVDCAAYWPRHGSSLWAEVGSSLEKELARYRSVIHLAGPPLEQGYEKNPLRVETADETRRIDERIHEAWESHPRRIVISGHKDFLSKALAAIEVIRSELPKCCRGHHLPGEEENEAVPEELV